MGPLPPKRGAIWAWVCALALVAALVWMWRLRVPDVAHLQPEDREAPVPLASMGTTTTAPPAPAGSAAAAVDEPGAARDGGSGEALAVVTPPSFPAPDAGSRSAASGGPRPALQPRPLAVRSVFAQVDGRSELDGPAPENPRIDHAADPRCVMPSNARDEQVKVQDGKLENVAIQLIPLDPKPPAPGGWRTPSGFLPEQAVQPRNVTLVEHGCELVPRVSMVTTGARIEVINHDYTRHELRLLRDGQTIAQAEVQPREKVKDLAADGPGLVEVRCARHPWERAFVMVAPSGARGVVTHSTGRFRLDALAPGRWSFKAWHERFGWQSKQLELQAGESLVLPVAYAVPAPPPVQLSTMPR